MRKISLRKRFFFAVEGESEQSFVKWLQELSDQNNAHNHLDCQVLGGGGYQSMLRNTIRYRKLKERRKVPTILMVDSDRSERDDGWSIDILKQKASQAEINVCLQLPNHEGLLLRLFPGQETRQITLLDVKKQLERHWPDYQKPVEARILGSRFKLVDLQRVAKADEEIAELLKIIGLDD